MVRITEDLVRKKSEHNELLISTLEEVSLHQEDIEKIEHIGNWCRELKILLLQSNLISKIENLHKLKKLEYLNLAINNIERIENLEKLESLNKLDLTLNFIGELTSVESLCDNYNLRELILTGNPCVDYPHYREYVIATLPQLTSLDCVAITRTDQLIALNNLHKYRSIIVQKQLAYNIERDEQKLRVLEQQELLHKEFEHIEDEEERIRAFWNTKSEHCPETRYEIAKYQKISRDKKNNDKDSKPKERKCPKLFAPCGRPYNLNQAKLPFLFQDEASEYILELEVYKHLDTSQIQADVETNYIRVTIKGKIFQVSLNEEVKVSEATVQRVEFTGKLIIKVPKLRVNEVLLVKSKREAKQPDKKKSTIELKGPVNINNICTDDAGLPDLI